MAIRVNRSILAVAAAAGGTPVAAPEEAGFPWMSASSTLEGAIKADGAYSNGEAAGGGSGGSILVQAWEIGGYGTISANGGGHTSSGIADYGTSGGGGRIALYFRYPIP